MKIKKLIQLRNENQAQLISFSTAFTMPPSSSSASLTSSSVQSFPSAYQSRNASNLSSQSSQLDSLTSPSLTTDKGFLYLLRNIREKKLKKKRSLITMKNIIYRSTVDNLQQEYYKKFNRNVQADREMSLNDFEGLKTIGTGSFGTVKVARLKATGEVCAIKIISKERVVSTNKVSHTLTEKRILRSVSHPFIISAFHHFQDNANLFIAMEFCAGGEFFSLLTRKGYFSEKTSSFYAAQVVMALEFLHGVDIIYRDLKPENILLDSKGYIKLADFGFAKETRIPTHTFCGTSSYMAPEIILNVGYEKSADWWSFGILLYEMVAGYTPFEDDDRFGCYNKILFQQLEIPKRFSRNLENLIRGLLVKDPSMRYGYVVDRVTDIKNHKWFKKVDWLKIFEQKVKPPFIPTVKHKMDTRNFDDYEEKEDGQFLDHLFIHEFTNF